MYKQYERYVKGMKLELINYTIFSGDRLSKQL